MATNFFDTAKSVKTGAEELLDRIKTNREALLELLASAKAAEGRLMEKEQREQREKAEKEKAERLKKFLESGESNAYVVDVADQVSEAAAKDASEPPAETPVTGETPTPVQPAPQSEAPVRPAAPRAAESPAQRPAPAQKPAQLGPTVQPKSPPKARKANSAVPTPGSRRAAKDKVEGHIMDTDRPHRAQPNRLSQGQGASAISR